MGADRTLRIAHGWDPRAHGLSLERVPLHTGHASGDAFSDLPPIGVPFVEVTALPDGDVMFALGARLVDNHVLREGGGRARASVIRAFAAALVRAADLTERASSSDQSHEEPAGERDALPSHRGDAPGGSR
ncbi:hypothetical protein [Methylobacterium sp. 285MFTsu5.1]|uniref:hypothetical protein n=1 Tax=Methylobacterium sp. 285MFTsu5.1 TaxID=1172187 RepID=UPI001319F891|nr:hypothetical protein [Methylobacterium sp. 285MFTsu5.1]